MVNKDAMMVRDAQAIVDADEDMSEFDLYEWVVCYQSAHMRFIGQVVRSLYESLDPLVMKMISVSHQESDNKPAEEE